MTDREFEKIRESEIVPKLLKVLEESGISMQQAETVPIFLEKYIKSNNFESTCRTPFRVVCEHLS